MHPRHQARAPFGESGDGRWPQRSSGRTFLSVIAPRHDAVPGWWIFPVMELVMLGALVVVDPGRIDSRSVVLRRATIG